MHDLAPYDEQVGCVLNTWAVSAGNDDELADWAAFQTATASAWKRGWAKGTLKEWGHDLLQKVLFKVCVASHFAVHQPPTNHRIRPVTHLNTFAWRLTAGQLLLSKRLKPNMMSA